MSTPSAPVVKTCALRARWSGEPPAIGAFLKAARGRTAYRIVAFRWIDPRKNARRYGVVFTVERVLPEDVPAEAIVYDWRWDARR